MKSVASFVLVFVLFLYSSVIAEQPSPMNIANFYTKENKTSILLNNGTQWIHDDAYLFAQNGWHINDRVNIVYVHLDGYFLENLSYPSSVPVKIENLSSADIMTARIQSITPTGDEGKKNIIVLNEGSQWFIGSWSSLWMKDWKPEDRVLIVPQAYLFPNKAKYMMINLDQQIAPSYPSNVRAELLFTPFPIVKENIQKRSERNYPHIIEKVRVGKNSSIIACEDKLLWESVKITKAKKQRWKSGDEIAFSSNLDGLSIVNLRSKETTKISWINPESTSETTLKIQEIANHDRKIILDDGSNWFINQSYDKNKTSWNPMDRIVVLRKSNPSIDTSTHVLINLDKTSYDGQTQEKLGHSIWSVTLMR